MGYPTSSSSSNQNNDNNNNNNDQDPNTDLDIVIDDVNDLNLSKCLQWQGCENLFNYSLIERWKAKYQQLEPRGLFMKRLLTFDPHNRITAKQAIHHKHFKSIGKNTSS